MAKQMITIHDLATNQVIEREMNAAEMAQFEKDKANNEAQLAKQATKDAAKQAVLDKLGLSADEVAALLA